MDWFTVERLDSDTYIISEYGHYEEPHCYLLLGGERALLIDTGLGVSDIGVVVRFLTGLPVTVCTTHVHWDHIGGHAAFSDHAVFESERDWLGHFPLSLSAVKAALLRDPCAFPADFSSETYKIYDGGAETVLHDGDVLSLGGRQLRVLHTPGHSPGHVCYFEAARGYLFSGDLLYAGTLDAFYPTTDPFAFRESVKTVRVLPVGGFCRDTTHWICRPILQHRWSVPLTYSTRRKSFANTGALRSTDLPFISEYDFIHKNKNILYIYIKRR